MTYEEAKQRLRRLRAGDTLKIDGTDAEIEHLIPGGSFILRKGGKRQAAGYYTAAMFLSKHAETEETLV